MEEITNTSCSCDANSIGGEVWDDKNGNGIKDTGEPLLTGVNVELLNFEGNVIETFTTEDGLYKFENLAAGPYVVKVALTPNLRQTAPGAMTEFIKGEVTGPWDYDDNNGDPVGPSDWGEIAPDADGLFQSPINITGVPAIDLTPIVDFDYHTVEATELVNKGFNVEVEYPEGNDNTLSYLGEEFELVQFHFHYSSEHELDGDTSDMEIHLVHRNEEGGLAVVGLFIEEGNTNKVLEPVFEAISHTDSTTETEEIEAEIHLDKLIPKNPEGWYYQGSLTTPPASEPVNWVVLKDPIELSSEQIEIFKGYLSSIGFDHNNRPVLPPNGRQLNEANHEVTLAEGESAENLDFGLVSTEITKVVGTQGNDTFVAGDPEGDFYGNYTKVFARGGNDWVDVSDAPLGNNRIFGGDGMDGITTGNGDQVFGGDGKDSLTAFGKDSYLYGGNDDDSIDIETGSNWGFGGDGNDHFTVTATGNHLKGGNGEDTFYLSGGGNNIIRGGADADQFWIVDEELPSSRSLIRDFAQDEDVIGIRGDFGEELNSFDDLIITTNAGKTKIAVHLDDEYKRLAVLNGEYNLTADDFVFQM